MPTGFGPADSGVLDGADGDLEHRNKLLLCLGTIRWIICPVRCQLMILRGALNGNLRKSFHT